ncbi:MAG: alpha-E domain-containing protein [Acidobacteria bacterium]|nr:alpha-E domain-containing protein [Acidobacteriota bacterium]
MLARNAECLYWMGRYFERTGHLCRLLRWQVESLVDRPIREIHFGWYRIYGSLGRRLPGADAELVGGGDDYMLVDSFALADDLTFERANVDSVWNGFTFGRENARQMRHHLSAEVWTNLNRAYLRFRKLRIEDIWKTAPETFYEGIAYDIDGLAGAADATMYHDDAWRFLRMGRFSERAQLTIALILAHVAATRKTGESLNDDWSSLLRVCQAVDVYRRRYGVAIRPHRVLDLLVTDERLPQSLTCGIDTVAAELSVINAAPGSSAELLRMARSLADAIRGDWPDDTDLEHRERILNEQRQAWRKLHGLVMDAYVRYPAEDA